MNISYEQIKAFIAVADCGSFSAAAKQLGKHRTTLGQVVTNLEIETNMELFDRTSRYPQLTEEGQVLYQHAKNLAETTRSFEQLCQNRERGIESEITIYHSSLVPMGLITDVMKGVRTKFPMVKVHWRQKNIEDVRIALSEGEADMAIMLVPAGQATTSIQFTYLLNMPFVLCATPDYIKYNQLTDLKALKRARQLLLEDYITSGLAKTLTLSNHAEEISSIDVLMHLLLSGEGWAIVPLHCAEPHVQSGQLVTIELDEINSTLQFPLNIWQRNAFFGPVAKEAIALLRQHSHDYGI